MKRMVFVLLIAIMLAGCGPSGDDLAFMLQETIDANPSQTAYPTSTVQPTFTEVPTQTPLPTYTPMPIQTRRPTYTPQPTRMITGGCDPEAILNAIIFFSDNEGLHGEFTEWMNNLSEKSRSLYSTGDFATPAAIISELSQYEVPLHLETFKGYRITAIVYTLAHFASFGAGGNEKTDLLDKAVEYFRKSTEEQDTFLEALPGCPEDTAGNMP